VSRPTAIDGTPYRPRVTASGSPEIPLSKLKSRARGMLKSSSMSRQDKDLIRVALARLQELSGELGQALTRDDPDKAARLEDQRTEMTARLSGASPGVQAGDSRLLSAWPALILDRPFRTLQPDSRSFLP
jgi:hypothetical protein